MARILSYGSLNLDLVYQVTHFVQAGETLSSASRTVHCGGKGLNQSIAAARAGGAGSHAGRVGRDGAVLTDALRDKFTRQTRLTQVDEGGDFAFEGEITGYTSTTASVSGSSETALLNRLTITVNVRFTNAVDESMSWKKTFSAFEDFDSSKLLNEIEGELIPQIVDKLVTDIFQASAANW